MSDQPNVEYIELRPRDAAHEVAALCAVKITERDRQLAEIRDVVGLPNFTHEALIDELTDDMATRAKTRELLGLISTASNASVLDRIRQLVDRRTR